jgi:hypothetical protein
VELLDRERFTKAFYVKTLGLRLVSEDGFALAVAGAVPYRRMLLFIQTESKWLRQL